MDTNEIKILVIDDIEQAKYLIEGNRIYIKVLGKDGDKHNGALEDCLISIIEDIEKTKITLASYLNI